MDAALIELSAFIVRDVQVAALTRSEEVGTREILALLRLDGIAGEHVQAWNDAAAKVLDFGEGVRLAAAIQREESLADFDGQFGRREVPSACLLILRNSGQ
jgi:hypothetical protein